MRERHVVAMGGGGFSAGRPAGVRSSLDRYVLGLTDARRPRICFVPTASGDALTYVVRFFDAFPAHSFDTSVLHLFSREIEDVAGFLSEQDVVYVGGGNTANMLATWRLHGVDVALRSAWGSGVIMAGVSAGANCWFDASTTDSFLLGHADPLLDGLGIVGGSFSPHYDQEPARRPSLLSLVGAGTLPDGLACDDDVAVHFTDSAFHAAISAREGAGAYRVTRVGSGAEEQSLEVELLS